MNVCKKKRGLESLARETMQVMGYDPVRALVELQEGANPDTRREVAAVLLPYAYPKLQSVEISADLRVEAREAGDRRRALAELMAQDPQLADAAQRLSLAAAQVELDADRGKPVEADVELVSAGGAIPLFRVGDKLIDVDPGELLQ